METTKIHINKKDASNEIKWFVYERMGVPVKELLPLSGEWVDVRGHRGIYVGKEVLCAMLVGSAVGKVTSKISDVGFIVTLGDSLDGTVEYDKDHDDWPVTCLHNTKGLEKLTLRKKT